MGLKIEKKDLETIEIYGEQFQISKPTVAQIVDYSKQAKQEDFDQVNGSIDLLVGLGLPKDLLMSMDPNDFSVLVEYIFVPKKK